MLPTPKIIAIDDNKQELDALTVSLAKIGVSCLGIHYSHEEGMAGQYPDVRVLFFDLHLLGNSLGTKSLHFSHILNCLHTVSPQGPYVIVVWSQHSDEVDDDDEGDSLENYISDRLDRTLPRPYGVFKLPKGEHISRDGESLHVSDPQALKLKIEELLSGHPQAKAILDWEKNLLAATSGTLSQLIELSGGDHHKLKSVMASLAIAAVGSKNVDQDRFSALNEVLMPILSDKLCHLVGEANDELWRNAFSVNDAEDIDPIHGAKVNKFINVSDSVANVRSIDRGAVILLEAVESSTVKFVQDLFGMPIGEVITRVFGIKGKKYFEGARWILLQGQAACDYAQRKPQVFTYFLGLEVCPSSIRSPEEGGIGLPDSLWVSPALFINGQLRKLLFNAGSLMVIPPSKIPAATVQYRLREQILNDLLYKLRGHQSRPGIVYFNC